MRILAVLGSRNPEGQTARACGALLEGATGGGAQVDQVFLPDIKIERCRQCDEEGWGICRREGHCVIEDDFSLVVDKIKDADAVVFATPVYFSDLSESLKTFLDRFRRITRVAALRKQIETKSAVGLCVAGGGGGGAPMCTVLLEGTLVVCGFDVVDLIPARRQNLDTKLDVLKITGKWLATAPSSE